MESGTRKQQREPFLPLQASRNEVEDAKAASAGKRPQGVARKRHVTRSTSRRRSTVAPGQPTPQSRQRDKFVSLSDETAQRPAHQDSSRTAGPQPPALQLGGYDVPSLFEELPAPHGRITVMCVADTLNRTSLEALLRSKFSRNVIHKYIDVVHLSLSSDDWPEDVFFFDYGVVVFWGLTVLAEQDLKRSVLEPCVQGPLPLAQVETEEFQYRYSALERPHVQNDVITVSAADGSDHDVKLAICHALAQSIKLAVYEERIMDVVLQTKALPEELARTGRVGVSVQDVARLIGQVFLQRCAVTLLSSVMDTPEFFWSAPDHLQMLYKRVCEYLELEERIEVLNMRFQVLQEMLDMVRNHQNNTHMHRLEWVVIWLIVVELVVGVFEVLELLGVIGRDSGW